MRPLRIELKDLKREYDGTAIVGFTAHLYFEGKPICIMEQDGFTDTYMPFETKTPLFVREKHMHTKLRRLDALAKVNSNVPVIFARYGFLVGACYKKAGASC